MYKKLVILFCLLFQLHVFALNIDSLKNELKLSKTNTESIAILNQFGIFYESISDYPKAFYYLNKAKLLNQNNIDVNQNIVTHNYIGYVYWHKSDYSNALFYHSKALELCKANNITNENLAFTYLMLGNDYYDKGDFNKTAKFYYESIKVAESINNKAILIQSYNRLSKLYFKMKDLKLAEELAKKSLKLNNENDKRELAVSFNSLGNIALEKKQTDSALFYFQKTLLNFEKCGDKIGQSIASINLGDTYLALDQRKKTAYLDSSYFYYKQSYYLNQIVDNKFGMIYGLWGMADIDFFNKKYSETLLKYTEALRLAVDIGAKSEELNLYFKKHELYDKMGQTDQSLLYLKKHIELKNKVESSEQAKQLLKQESKYEYDKLMAQEKALAEQNKLIEAEKNKWKNIILILVLSVSVVLLFVTYTSIKRLKIIRSKNALINQINKELEFQKQEIIDSITYAKRIQQAILPPLKLIKETLPESFVVYLPKDIVAGDFYWMECLSAVHSSQFTVNSEQSTDNSKLILFAAADCTGHGVPGAMVSVVCNNGLNRSVREHHIMDPGKILEKTREIIVSEFEKSDEEVKDGMDISLCALGFSSDKKLLKWAGANNPLWIIRHCGLDPESHELIELKPTKQHLGKVDNPLPFVTQEFELQKGDTFYLFTDGFKDQFGGEKGKKFKSANFKKLLLSIQNLSMDEQKQFIYQTFMDWKGSLEQIDDVCIIGVRV
ncbi:MAG: tetratricopeptide repeat protein [Flavobacteriales bacterium]|nr:tetratricopeptide repeat protein [Flavobacteriales bacterium]